MRKMTVNRRDKALTKMELGHTYCLENLWDF